MTFHFIKKLENKKTPVIVLAASFGALAVIRELGKHAVPTIVVGNPTYIGKSRYCYDLHIKEPEEIVQFLREFPQHVSSKPVLFTDNEEHLQLLLNNWGELSDHYVAPFHLGNRRLTDKLQLYENALKAGVKAPTTYTGDEQRHVRSFPVIVKPLNDDKLWAESGLNYRKVYACHNESELKQTLNMLQRYDAHSVTQEIVPGDVKNLFCITLYRNVLGRVVIGFAVKKLRQFPLDYGTGTIHITCIQEKLIEHSVRLLEAANYVGIAMIEYKYDPVNEQFYIIEVNGRFPVETGIVHKLGNDFVYEVYQDLLHPSTHSCYTLPETAVAWIYFLNNLRSIVQSGAGWLKDVTKIISKYKIQSALWDWSDPLPTVYFPGYVLRRMVGSPHNRFWRRRKVGV